MNSRRHFPILDVFRGLSAAAASLLLAACGPSVSQPDSGRRPERVVSLVFGMTEIICAIGASDCLVGRTSACDYPPDIVRDIPVVGAFGSPAMESLLAVRPTLVIDTDLEDESVAATMAAMGINRMRVPCATLADVPGAIEAVGLRLGRATRARELAENIRRQVAAAKAECAQRALSERLQVFLEIWNDPLMTVGRNSFVSELIALAGGRNIGDAVTNREYYAVSSEWVLAQNPGIVICLYMIGSGPGDDPGAGALKLVKNRPGWDVTRAVREGRVHGGLNNDVILRPGPRILEGLEALRQCIEGRQQAREKGGP